MGETGRSEPHAPISGEQRKPAVGAGFGAGRGTVCLCLCETLTSPGGFPNYKLDFHTPVYRYTNRFNRAGIPKSLPKFDLKSYEILVYNRAMTLTCP